MLADQSSTRRGLELQKQQLLISIEQLALLVATIGELPPPDFGLEDAAIATTQMPLSRSLKVP